MATSPSADILDQAQAVISMEPVMATGFVKVPGGGFQQVRVLIESSGRVHGHVVLIQTEFGPEIEDLLSREPASDFE